MPTRNASARTGIVSVKEATSAMKKASTPAVMQPLFGLSDSPAQPGVSRDFCRVWGSAPKHSVAAPTQPYHHTAETPARPAENNKRLPLRQHSSKRSLHFVAVFAGVIPIDRLLQPLLKHRLRFPAQQTLRQRVIRHAIQRSRGHFRTPLDFRLMPGELAHHLRALQHRYALHRSQVDPRPIADFFAGRNRSLD